MKNTYSFPHTFTMLMQYKVARILTHLLLFLFTSSAYGYNMRQLTNRDGLSCSLILNICQDSRGFMWFGTFDGLNMYDSNDIRVYKSKSAKNSFSSQVIRKVIETQPGVFWLSTNLGLNKFTLATNDVKPYYRSTNVQRIFKDSKDRLFALVKTDTLSYYDKENDRFVELPFKGLNNEWIVSILFDQNNRLWIFMSEGSHFQIELVEKEGKITLKRLGGMQYEHRPRSLFYENGHFYYLDMLFDFYSYDIRSKQKTFLGNIAHLAKDKGTITSIIPISKNKYLIAFEIEGLLQLNINEKSNEISVENHNIKCGIYDMYYDKRQDIVWVATAGQGVYILWNDNFSILNLMNRLFPSELLKPVRALHLDKRNNLWIGTNGDGIARIKDFNFNKEFNLKDNVSYYTSVDNQNLQLVFSFAESRNDILWIGGDWHGLSYYSYKDNKVHSTNTYNRNEQNYINFVHEIIETNDSTLWLGTFGMGLLKAVYDKRNFSIKSVKRLTFFPQMGGTSEVSYERYNSLYQENDSILWLGARMNGVVRLNTNTEKFQIFRFEQEGIEQLNDILSIHKDVHGQLWFGSNFGLIKVAKIDNGKMSYTVINESNGLSNNAISGILSDKHGNIFVSHNKGIDMYHPKTNNIRKINYRFGLEMDEFSLDAFYETPDKELLFFGAIDGSCIIRNEKERRSTAPIDIHFMGIKIFGEYHDLSEFSKETNTENSIKLNYKQNYFSIIFASPDYVNSNNITYAYQLENYSNRWIELNNSNSITFTNIAPGTYKLHIRYKLDSNDYVQNSRVLTIVITPPWYKSTLAYVIYIICLAIAIYFLFKNFKRRRIEKKQIEMEQLNQQQKQEVYNSRISFWNKISSELSTPITLILNPCQLLLEYEKNDHFIISNLKLIHENTGRMNQLIQQLEELKQSDSQNNECVISSLNVWEVCCDPINQIEELCKKKNIHFKCTLDTEMTWNSNPTHLSMIIDILLSNALKHIHSGGRIMLTFENTAMHLKIYIHYTGKDIKNFEYHSQMDKFDILDNFQDSSASFEESLDTLNMGICINLLRSLHGEIRISGEKTEYTELNVSLPFQEITIPEKIKKTNLVPKKNTEKNKIGEKLPNVILIDKDLEIASFLFDVFRNDYFLMIAQTQEEANSIIESKHIDIIIFNSLSDGSSNEIVLQFKNQKNTRHIPLILLAADTNEIDHLPEDGLGADAYIEKPFNINYLRTRIQTMLRHSDYLREFYSSSISTYEKEFGTLVHRDDKLFLNRVIEVIELNAKKKDLSPEFIAGQLNMSKRKLQRDIKESTGLTLNVFIKEHKLTMSTYKLRSTTNSIQEIMFDVGFNSRPYFYQEFTKKYGVTPKQYRQEQLD